MTECGGDYLPFRCAVPNGRMRRPVDRDRAPVRGTTGRGLKDGIYDL